jgi:DNA-binding response OmpR family regulator
VILLDLMMPGMNGRQFLTALRTELALSVPVVVMTAVHGLGQRAISLGATDVVEKPFDVDELLNKVALAVFRAHQVAPVDSQPPDTTLGPDRVVVVIDHDLAALARVDAALTAAGFTVVALPGHDQARPLPRLVNALGACAVVVVVDGTHDGGETIAGELRGDPALAGLPVLAVTRGETRADVARAVDRMAAITLVRPADEDLVRALAVVGRRATSWAMG